MLQNFAEMMRLTRAGAEIPLSFRARFRWDAGKATDWAVYAVDRLVMASGGRGIFLSNPIQRAWRDVQAMQAHAGSSLERAAAVFGRSEFGLPPTDLRFSGGIRCPQSNPLCIPVSDIERSTRFYTEIVRCRHLATVGCGTMAFLDAAGTCLILVKRDPPINPRPEDHGGVHHSFAIAHEDSPAALDHLRKNGVEITFEEDRQGCVVNGPRAYFHDPDGTVLEFIDLTSYAGAR